MTTIPAKNITVVGGKLMPGTQLKITAMVGADSRIIYPFVEIHTPSSSIPILTLEFNSFGAGNFGAKLNVAKLLKAFDEVWVGENVNSLISSLAISQALKGIFFRLESGPSEQISIQGVMTVDALSFHNLHYRKAHDKELVEKIFSLRRPKR